MDFWIVAVIFIGGQFLMIAIFMWFNKKSEARISDLFASSFGGLANLMSALVVALAIQKNDDEKNPSNGVNEEKLPETIGRLFLIDDEIIPALLKEHQNNKNLARLIEDGLLFYGILSNEDKDIIHNDQKLLNKNTRIDVSIMKSTNRLMNVLPYHEDILASISLIISVTRVEKDERSGNSRLGDNYFEFFSNKRTGKRKTNAPPDRHIQDI